jgi:hypothetical protein
MQDDKVESRHTVRDNTIPWIEKLLEIDRTGLDVCVSYMAFYFMRFEAAAAIAVWKP